MRMKSSVNGILNVPIAVRASAYWWIPRFLNKTTSRIARFAVVPSTFVLKSSPTATPMCGSRVKMNERRATAFALAVSGTPVMACHYTVAGEAGIRAETIPFVSAMTSPSPICSHGSSVNGTLATSASS